MRAGRLCLNVMSHKEEKTKWIYEFICDKIVLTDYLAD